MRNQVFAKIEEMKILSQQQWGIDIDVLVTFDIKSKRTLGLYYYDIPRIDLNPLLLEEYKEVYINDVVVHEFCHSLVHNMYPNLMNKGKKIRPHGKEFKKFCKFFGNPGKSSSDNFEDSKHLKSTQKRIPYVCGCKEKVHEISKIRHNKMLRGVVYQCGKCKEIIKLKEE